MLSFVAFVALSSIFFPTAYKGKVAEDFLGGIDNSKVAEGKKYLHSCTQHSCLRSHLHHILQRSRPPNMDKRMHLSEKMSMESNAENQESNGETFVHRVASSGKVLKFKVDKYGTLPSKQHTISSQEVMMSGGKQDSKELLDNNQANCSSNANPALLVHTCDECGKCFKEISSLHGHKGVHRREEKKRMHMMMANQQPVAVEASANCSSNANPDLLVHTCDECGKCFKEISSLHGHKGVHRREEKRMHMMMADQQPVAVEASYEPREKKKDEMNIWLAAQAIEELWMRFERDRPDFVLARMTSSNKHISAVEETDEMREVAEILATLAQSFCKDDITVHVSSSVSTPKCFVCPTCKKMFSSYHALGGHMSSHNKPTKNSLLGDGGGAGSSGGDREQCTWKYVCDKCNKKFETGQILGGHKRGHWWEEYYNKKALEDRMSLVPTDEKIQPAGKELVVAAHTVPLLACDDVQQPQQAMNLGSEIELPVPSGVSDEDVA